MHNIQFYLHSRIYLTLRYHRSDVDDTASSDDEPTEEKDHFVAQLYKFMEECGTPINNAPTVSGRDLDLYKLFKVRGMDAP